MRLTLCNETLKYNLKLRSNSGIFRENISKLEARNTMSSWTDTFYAFFGKKPNVEARNTMSSWTDVIAKMPNILTFPLALIIDNDSGQKKKKWLIAFLNP